MTFQSYTNSNIVELSDSILRSVLISFTNLVIWCVILFNLSCLEKLSFQLNLQHKKYLKKLIQNTCILICKLVYKLESYPMCFFFEVVLRPLYWGFWEILKKSLCVGSVLWCVETLKILKFLLCVGSLVESLKLFTKSLCTGNSLCVGLYSRLWNFLQKIFVLGIFSRLPLRLKCQLISDLKKNVVIIIFCISSLNFIFCLLSRYSSNSYK